VREVDYRDFGVMSEMVSRAGGERGGRMKRSGEIRNIDTPLLMRLGG
jgi:hypothetical protein